jgi:hypothetical protein
MKQDKLHLEDDAALITLAKEDLFALEGVATSRRCPTTHRSTVERSRDAGVAFGGSFKVEAGRSTDFPCMAQEEVSSRGLDDSGNGGGGGGGNGVGDKSGAGCSRKQSVGIGAGGIRSSSISSLDRSNDYGIGAVGGGVIGSGGFRAADYDLKQNIVKIGPSSTALSSSQYLASSARHLTRDLAGCLRNKLVCIWTMFTKRKKGGCLFLAKVLTFSAR